VIDLGERDPRDLAFVILDRVEHGEAWSSVLLQRLGAGLAPRDAGLLTELVQGVLRRRLSLDASIAALSARPLRDIDPPALLALRLGLYQLLHLERIPDHAIVNESVRLARRHARPGRGRSVAAFVNGVLRAATRDRAKAAPAPEPSAGGDPVEAIALGASFPSWIARRWVRRFGLEEASLLLDAQNRPAPTMLRVNRRVATPAGVAAALAAEGVETMPGRHLDAFLRVAHGTPQRTASFRRGEFYIQDEASGLVARLAGWGGGAEGQRVLDACAAPGGKTLALAETVGEGGLVVAADLHPARLSLLRANAARLGLDRCLSLAADMSGPPPLAAGVSFDTVLVDAPCSGTGVIRRNPELRYRVTQEALERLAGLQSALLGHCAALVRPGGLLVYSVCSLEPEEGEERIAAFLPGHDRFRVEDPRPTLPPSAASLAVDAPGGGGFLVTRPDRDDLDGFFAAILRRQR